MYAHGAHNSLLYQDTGCLPQVVPISGELP